MGERAVVSEVLEGREKWVKHYSSFHQILLVGEGDFSFSLSLALSFGSASNIVASSLDQYDVVINKYKKAKSNLEKLEKLGASLLHGVDATKMKLHTDLQRWKFDRIIFNFPHAGFHGKEDQVHLIKMHRNLVRGFFRNASGMLRANAEIHVSHKTTAPFCQWNLEELASWNSLALSECVDFKREDYPGYNNKRGAGLRCDVPFFLGECSTFKFRLSLSVKRISRGTSHLGLTHRRHQQFQMVPIQIQQQPTSFQFRHPQAHRRRQLFQNIPIQMMQPQPQPQPTSFDFRHSQTNVNANMNDVAFHFRHPRTNFIVDMNDVPGYVGSPLTISIRNGYFNHVAETFGRTGYNVGFSVHEALRLGIERYMIETPGRTLNGYIHLLQELHALRLQMMLLGPDHQL